MEIDGAVTQPDGNVTAGLTPSEWEEYLKTYHKVSREEMIHLRDIKSGRPFNKLNFEFYLDVLHYERVDKAESGLHATHVSPLFMLLSVHVKPRKRKSSSSSSSSCLSVYGEITSALSFDPHKADYIYKRELEDAENFGSDSDGGYLTLNGPSKLCRPDDAYFLFQSRKLHIRLYDQQRQQLLVDDNPIILDYSGDEFEQVKEEVVQNTEISLTLKYVSIPMAVYGLLEIGVYHRVEDTNLPKFVNMYIKVVAKYKNTFGNYKSQEIVLFDKSPVSNQYETLDLDKGANFLSSSRCWVAAPVFSMLQLQIDLFDSQKEPISTQVVELETYNCFKSANEYISGDYFVSVSSSWFTPYTQPLAQDARDVPISRSLKPYVPAQPQPPSKSALEVFSAFLVCSGTFMPLQIHGHLRFTSTVNEMGFDIFRKEKEDHPLTLLRRGDTIPMLNGSRLLAGFGTLTVLCDLKDATSPFSIKGYEDFDVQRYAGEQVCSIFQGDPGFVALHYTVFPSAVQANLDVFVRQQKGSQCAVSGSIYAQYKDFDYSSEYKKNCFRIVLFKSSREDLVQTDADGSIPLSRSSFVVPSYSSSVFDLDLMIGTQNLSGQINIGIGIGKHTGSIKEGDCEVEFVLEWSVVK